MLQVLKLTPYHHSSGRRSSGGDATRRSEVKRLCRSAVTAPFIPEFCEVAGPGKRRSPPFNYCLTCSAAGLLAMYTRGSALLDRQYWIGVDRRCCFQRQAADAWCGLVRSVARRFFDQLKRLASRETWPVNGQRLNDVALHAHDSELRDLSCHMESHGVSCQPATQLRWPRPA